MTTDDQQPLDETRWQGFSHEQLYTMLHTGPGATGSAIALNRWTELTGTLTDVELDLQKALARSATTWGGEAAEMAYNRLGTLAAWANRASVSAGLMKDGTEHQAEHIAKARADMPAPTDAPPVSPEAAAPLPAGQVLAVQTDQEPTEASGATGEQRAFEVMLAYQKNTTTNLDTLTSFEQPESVTQTEDIAHGEHTGVRQGTGAQSTNWSGGTPVAPEAPHSVQPPTHVSSAPSGGAVSTSGAEFVEIETRPRPAAGIMTGASPMDTFSGTPGVSGVRGSGRDSSRSGLSLGRGPASTGPVSSVASTGAHAEMGPATAGGTPLSAGTNSSGSATTAGNGQAGGNAQDKLGARRLFGADPATSGQWLGEGETLERTPTRKRDFTSSVKVTQKVSVDGEEVELPEQTIGESLSR